MALIQQFIRFVGIGFLNTAVDYAVFNFAAASTAVYIGRGAGYLTAISFTVAVFHSYFWNKHWAFANENKSADAGIVKNTGQFIAAAVLGALVIGAIVFGAGQKYGDWFYLVMFMILLFGEATLWKVFHLAQNVVTQKSGQELFVFIIVSLVGVLINYLVVNFGTSHIPPQLGLGQELWTNVIKAAATGISLVWNFLGYRVFVFKKT